MHERFAGSDSSPSALLERIRSAPRETFQVRLVAWSVGVAGISLAAQRAVIGPVPVADKGLLAAVLAIGLCSGLGLSAYCFARFMLGRELRFLLASAAFSALGGGSLLQAAADLRCPDATSCAWIMTSGWLVASVLFVGAAESYTVWRRSSRYEVVQQFVLAVLAVIAFPLAALPYALDTSLLSALGLTEQQAFTANAVEGAAGVVATTLILLSLLGMLRRVRTCSQDEGASDDRFSALMCYFLAPCVLGLMLRTASCGRFDAHWRSGEAILAGAWLALVVRTGIENALAHRESADRFRELDTLHQVSWSLVGAGTVGELLNLFVDTLVDKVGARIAAVYLVDDAREKLELAAISGCDESAHPVGSVYAVRSLDDQPGFHSGHTASAFTSRKLRIARGVFVDVELVPWRVIAVDDGAAASFPLIHRGEAIGVLSVYFSDRRQLDAQRIKLISTIATAATPAIEYARAREERMHAASGCEAMQQAA